MTQVDHVLDARWHALVVTRQEHQVLRPNASHQRAIRYPVGRRDAKRASPELARAVELRLQAVHRPDERGHEQARGLGVQRFRRSHLLEHAEVHDGDAIGNRHRFLLVVRDEHGGDADATLDSSELRAHIDAQLSVEVRQRLVQQQDARLEHERACERDALLLPTRELRRVTLAQSRQAHQLQRRFHTPPHLVARPTPHLQPKGDVVEHGHVRPQRVALKNHGRGPALRRLAQHTCAVDSHVSAVGLQKSTDNPQCRRLAAPRRAQQAHQLAVADLEREVPHGRRFGTASVAFDQAIELQPGHAPNGL